MLKNEYLVAKVGFRTAENEPLKVCSCIYAPPTPGHKFRSGQGMRPLYNWLNAPAKIKVRHAGKSRNVVSLSFKIVFKYNMPLPMITKSNEVTVSSEDMVH